MSDTFSRLPTELRHCIWNLVLDADGDPPTMVPFRTSRPYMLEEEDDDDDEDDDMIMDADEAGEIISEEQFDQIRQLALHITGQNGGSGQVNPAPTILPSNGVAREVAETADEAGDEQIKGENVEGVNGCANGETHGGSTTGATDEAPIEIADENDEEENELEGDEGDDDVEEDDGVDEDYLDSFADEFEPGNPYIQERAWDDEVVIPVYIPPLLLVNREARSIALAWLKKHNIEILRNTIAKGEIDDGFSTSKDDNPPCVRKYDPERDSLYVDRHYWRRFCDRLQMPHMMAPDEGEEQDEDDAIHDIGVTIKRLALPAFTVYQSVSMVGHILQFLPNIEQISCIWGDLPEKKWKPQTVFTTVQRDGKPKTQVTNVLVPRLDQAVISEQLSQEELDKRQEDMDRIKAERQQELREKQEKRDKAEKEGEKDGEDEDEESDEDDDADDDEDEEEGTGPIVTMCIRDPSDDTKIFYERGYLTDWLNEIYNELALSELPEHVTDAEDGSFTLPIVPCSVVTRKQE